MTKNEKPIEFPDNIIDQLYEALEMVRKEGTGNPSFLWNPKVGWVIYDDIAFLPRGKDCPHCFEELINSFDPNKK